MSKKLGIKIDELITLYNQGNTPAQIAELYGCCVSNITRRLKKQELFLKEIIQKLVIIEQKDIA